MLFRSMKTYICNVSIYFLLGLSSSYFLEYKIYKDIKGYDYRIIIMLVVIYIILTIIIVTFPIKKIRKMDINQIIKGLNKE